jgi:lysophospholipase L1-like esterase
VLATGWHGRGSLTRIRRLGALGAVVLLTLAATIAVAVSSRPAAAARRGADTAARRSASEDPWVTSWTASPQRAIAGTLSARGFANQTVRDVITSSVGGEAIRLELTNAYGGTPLRVGHVTVALAEPGTATVVPVSLYPVTYRGRSSFQIPAGAQILSDPVSMRVWPMQPLAVSIYLPGRTGPATFHWDAYQFNWVSAPGDHAADSGSAAFTVPSLSWYYLSGLVVQSPDVDGTVVAFGDSITDGVGSSIDADARWPDDLARRLDQLSGPTLAVADAGIGGNRVLAGSRWFGVSAEARFGRDALDQPGVRDIIVLEGINDIGFGTSPRHPGTAIPATAIIAGYRQLIVRAHARGLKIFGATLLPFQGAGYYSARAEATREAVNHWIRTSGAFDGVIDFDAVMRDPADPLRLNPEYDSGDHLHPNDAGYQAMASAIDLGMLVPPPPGRPG